MTQWEEPNQEKKKKKKHWITLYTWTPKLTEKLKNTNDLLLSHNARQLSVKLTAVTPNSLLWSSRFKFLLKKHLEVSFRGCFNVLRKPTLIKEKPGSSDNGQGFSTTSFRHILCQR